MNTFSHLLPGFRFHPTEEELVDYYLRKKIASKMIDLDVIKDVDLYKIEPWDLTELCRIGSEEENEWYFFSHKDKKYPTGTRTNRATKAGFWKATGRDKAIYSRHSLIGMRKTLVFYKGRAPNGQRSDWIVHEYRLETHENAAPQEEGWVVCRVFKKRLTAVRKAGDCYDSLCSWYDDQVSIMQELDSPGRRAPVYSSGHLSSHHFHLPCKQELELQYSVAGGGFPVLQHTHMEPNFLQLPQLDSTKLLASHPYCAGAQDQPNVYNMIANNNSQNEESNSAVDDQVTDWRVLDKFVASQLSRDEDNGATAAPSKGQNFSGTAAPAFSMADQMKANSNQEYGSTSTLNCQIDLWK